jgi:hypothetical protein
LLAGRYFVEMEIGRGGQWSGVPRSGPPTLHSRPAVIKFLHAAWEDHDRIRLKFRQEIEALSRLNHPVVVGGSMSARPPTVLVFRVRSPAP